MKETWFVEADCDEVNIQSEMFHTEKKYDVVTISDQDKSQRYSGKQLVYQSASSSFSIAFQVLTSGFSSTSSDSSSSSYSSSSSSHSVRHGFILNWTCIKPKQT